MHVPYFRHFIIAKILNSDFQMFSRRRFGNLDNAAYLCATEPKTTRKTAWQESYYSKNYHLLRLMDK